MSEHINNREIRKNAIKDIIKELHEGRSVEEVKDHFEKIFTGVAATEISEAEGALVAEGLPVEEIQKLCDVHASVFKGSIEEIHESKDPSLQPGHPVYILKLENRELERIIATIRSYQSKKNSQDSTSEIQKGLSELSKINIHYKKKENLLFPYMEKNGITAPPKVMWGVDDEIRTEIKEVRELFEKGTVDSETGYQRLDGALVKIEEMIFKEEQIMIPMLIDVLTQSDWKLIAEESSEIGFIVEPIPVWEPVMEETFLEKQESEEESEQGLIQMPSGVLKLEELVSLLNILPMDITFVNKENEVKYFSEGKNRAFPRTRAIIGRNVSNCHPPASVHVVEKLVEDFRAGIKNEEDFWIKAGTQYVLIRYYAVRNEQGEYLGVLEVTQDIKPIQEIVGEKRLLS